MIKKLGIPKEVKKDEGRVSLIPEHITQFTGLADIFVETNAGLGSGFTDEDYESAGAKIVPNAQELYGVSEIICKVKEHQEQEFELLRSSHVIFGYLHLASNLSGNLAIQKCMQFLEYSSEGKGLLLSSISDERNSKVTVIGCGEVGRSSIHKSVQIGASVTAIDVNENILNELKNKYGEDISTHISGSDDAIAAIRTADLVVGAVLLPGRKPPIVITPEDINQMEKGSVIIDVAIDQGGCVEGVTANTHSEPFEIRNGVIVSAIANLPGAVPKTSSIELSTNMQKFVDYLLIENWFEEYNKNQNLKPSLQIHNGLLLSEEVAESLSLSLSKLV